MDIQKEIDRRFKLQVEYGGTDKEINRVEPIVSITVAAYNHENYIRQCLDGILMQQCDFLSLIISIKKCIN